jgi:arylsulfatase
MKYAGLYHLNAYTYADRTWFPDMSPELRHVHAGDEGRAGRQVFKVNVHRTDHPHARRAGPAQSTGLGRAE